jgi:prepilin-type processing-associated H-X9-DG protein
VNLKFGNLFMRPLKKHAGFTAVEFLLVSAMMVLFLTLLLPGLMESRRAARQTQCLNNLNQIGVALQNYEAVMGVLPPGCVNPTGPILNEPVGYHMNWAMQSLAMMDYNAVFESVDWQYGAYSTTSTTAMTNCPTVLMCPSDPVYGETYAASYAGSIGGTSSQIDVNNTGLLYLNSSISDHQIPDGRSNTLLIGEIRVARTLTESGLGWTSGTAATLRSSGVPLNSTDDSMYEIITAEAGGFGGWHDGSVSMLFADGAVQTMSANTDPDLLIRLGDRHDGQMLETRDLAVDKRTRNLLQRRAMRLPGTAP